MTLHSLEHAFYGTCAVLLTLAIVLIVDVIRGK